MYKTVALPAELWAQKCVLIKIKGTRAYKEHSALNASFQFKNRPRMAVFEERVAGVGTMLVMPRWV